MAKKREKTFQVKISSLGTNDFNASYGIVKNKNALKLLYGAIARIGTDIGGEKNCDILIYHTCLTFLSELRKDFLKLFPEYTKEKLKEIEKQYDIVDE